MKTTSFLLVLTATALLSSACSWRTYNVKHSSELHTILQQEGVRYDVKLQEVRSEIIEGIPVGSTEQEIREFCKAHFTKGPRNKHTTPTMLIPEELRGLEHLCVELRSHVDIPVGSSQVEVIFFLDEDRRFKDAVVKYSGDYL